MSPLSHPFPTPLLKASIFGLDLNAEGQGRDAALSDGFRYDLDICSLRRLFAFVRGSRSTDLRSELDTAPEATHRSPAPASETHREHPHPGLLAETVTAAVGQLRKQPVYFLTKQLLPLE